MLPVMGFLRKKTSAGKREFSVIADTRQLKSLLKKVEKLGPSNGHVRAGLDEIGARWVAKVRLNFRNSVSPYGQAWAPVKHRKGQPLIDTGTLVASIQSETKGLSIHLGTPLYYADDHNTGRHVIKRQFLPDEDRNLPAAWHKEYIDIITRQVEKALK